MKELAALGIVIASLLAGSVAAQTSQRFGHWEVQKSSPRINLAATKSGGNEAGVFCLLGADGCYAYIAIDGVDCDEGAQYPALINSTSGAGAVTTTCTLVAGQQLFVIDTFEYALAAFQGSGEFGIAFPLKNGRYEVARFSTRGAKEAIDSARTRREPARTKNPSRETI